MANAVLLFNVGCNSWLHGLAFYHDKFIVDICSRQSCDLLSNWSKFKLSRPISCPRRDCQKVQACILINDSIYLAGMQPCQNFESWIRHGWTSHHSEKPPHNTVYKPQTNCCYCCWVAIASLVRNKHCISHPLSSPVSTKASLISGHSSTGFKVMQIGLIWLLTSQLSPHKSPDRVGYRVDPVEPHHPAWHEGSWDDKSSWQKPQAVECGAQDSCSLHVGTDCHSNYSCVHQYQSERQQDRDQRRLAESCNSNIG